MASPPRVSSRTRKGWRTAEVQLADGARSGAHRVLAIAAALCSTTVLTASLGFVFWAVAARMASPAVVGRAAAVISATEFIATFATLGMHTLLIAELPRRLGADAKRLILTCFGIAGCVAFAAATGFALIHRSASNSQMMDSPVAILLFGLGTAVSTVAIVTDGALIGLQRSRLQVARNLIFAVTKLVALPIVAIAVGLSPEAVFVVWVLGNVVSLVLLSFRSRSMRSWLAAKPTVRGFVPIWRTAAGHHWVNVATQSPRLLLPVLVAAQLSEEANAGFYAALLIITFIWIIPNHLGTAMFALHSDDPQHFRAGLDTVIRLSAVVAVAAAIGGPLLARPLLSIFGPAYEEARYCLAALAICTFAGAIKSIYISVRRAQGALGIAARAAIVGALFELTAAEVGLLLGGVSGVGIGLGAATVVEVMFFLPVILRARRQAQQASA